LAKTSQYQKRYHIDLRDVDFRKELKLSTLFSFFQDAASAACDELGIGIDRLVGEFNVAWVLIRMRVEIVRMPRWNEDITVETWPQEPKTLEFERDFTVRDQDGNVIIRALSTWIIYDVTTKRIRKSSLIAIDYPPIIEERALNNQLKKLTSHGTLEPAYQKVIGYSDIDLNGHLNNSKYIDYIMDCFPYENHQVYTVESIEVNFIKEALPGDTLTLLKDLTDIDDLTIYIEGVETVSQATAFKARVKIKNRLS